MRAIETDDPAELASVCVCDMWLRCAKTAELIEVHLGLETLRGPRHIEFDAGLDPLTKTGRGLRENFAGCAVQKRLNRYSGWKYTNLTTT